MTLSIDVLPAPFGPMMARISPLRMSSDTSLIALTPPNDNETFSTDSRTSPTATSGPVAGALMRPDLVLSFPGAPKVRTRNPDANTDFASGFRVPRFARSRNDTWRSFRRLQNRLGDRRGFHLRNLHARLE